MPTRPSLRLRVFLRFALLMAGAVAALVLGLWLGYRRLDDPAALEGFVQAGLVAVFVLVGLVLWVWFQFDATLAKPVEALAGALRARAHADVPDALDPAIARHLGDLAPAAAAVSASLSQTRSTLAQVVARETSALAAERDRLESLLADVPVGVLLCNGDHALAFYNGPAVDLMAAGTAPGLDRPLFDYLRDGPLRLAHDRLVATGDPEAATDLLCTTIAGARVLQARMRLRPGGADLPGYVLTLRDVTADLAAHARRESLLAEVMDRARRPAANLSTLLEVIPEGEAWPAPMDAALRAEVQALAAAITDLSRRHDEGRLDSWPLAQTLAQTRASDLADGLKARLEDRGLTLQTSAAPLLLRCNGFEIISLLDDIGAGILAEGLARDLRLTVEEEDSGAMIRLLWQGGPLPVGLLDRWLAEPLDRAVPDIACRSVLASHATDIWPEPHGPDQSLCLPIPQARRETQRPTPVQRRVVYDFDLLERDRAGPLAETPLAELTYVVFDTETTGLLPQQGDEIVQIAAVRIVNGRRVQGEVFDTLVNPRRAIPAASTAVHGITDAMVADAPESLDVAQRFHKFAEGAVLIAHNAPFDMAFLRRLEPNLPLRFDHPVLDTVLLSAVVYGQHAEHSLDALTHRLGITIPEEARHTAIGDTIATADAFLKLMPILQGRGLVTFADVLAEVRQHGRLLKDLNG